jgi:dephospho-CoA kinase
MSIIGITGGIGSGKSVVAHLLSAMGYPVYDSDEEAKKLMNYDLILREQLIALFGNDLYHHGVLNKKYLADIVFAHPAQLQTLNDCVHPAVKNHLRNWANQQNVPIVFLESAILFESGFESETNKIILVTAPLEKRMKRVMLRDNCTREQVQQRIARQWTDEAKAGKADYIVVNDDFHSLIEQIEAIINTLISDNTKSSECE